ncbi:dihydrolipoyllysine-residue acetyltransferase [Halieaceae bacterium IMCC14734]|uniref:Acetyltransferase component of pyruvate dehydrogenase complex n=1 Tax=Candidatus Litorirhabdus singularis TaxID=2518993 RepID=A0ABT3TLN4_9GAMM|nr:dihydrolipoyllysine-residue acetyltransferase [Candidatus Litorirhabdus singularis]MCX2983247.1 dihydrolipoyllysine-residue acetyltransferase [Candidatus Litorirhabdus singularis]
MSRQTLKVPDIGGAEDSEVIELCVQVGDRVELEQGLIVLESDKASMEIPADQAGVVVEILVKEGDTLAEGAAIVVLETEAATEASAAAEASEGAEESVEVAPETVAEPAVIAETVIDKEPAPDTTAEVIVSVPDIGTPDAVELIEICVAVGDHVDEGDSLVVLESDKASMEIPSPQSGEVLSLAVAVGDQVTEGDKLLVLVGNAVAVTVSPSEPEPKVADPAPAEEAAKAPKSPPINAQAERSEAVPVASGGVYAGPAVRKLAREFGVGLEQVAGSGPRGRIVKEDLQGFVKSALAGGTQVGTGSAIPPIPEVDFAAFGEVDIQPLTKVDKLTAVNMQRSWLNVPHVTQFDEADITELEAFRAELKAEAAQREVKLTPLPFLLKACAQALRDNPRMNSSLIGDGENIAFKGYVHIGMAVDTPAGLVVPVIRDVDKKSLWELAAETAELAEKARNRKLRPLDMQGGCFSISSLGGLGGTGFTPIVNAPEVAILGVSKLAVKPVWDGEAFAPRKMLPLALSYDHRVVNGALGGKFITEISALLADIRRLLL